jgi:hypothetical protein
MQVIIQDDPLVNSLLITWNKSCQLTKRREGRFSGLSESRALDVSVTPPPTPTRCNKESTHPFKYLCSFVEIFIFLASSRYRHTESAGWCIIIIIVIIIIVLGFRVIYCHFYSVIRSCLLLLRPVFASQQRVEIFLFTTIFRPAVVPAQSPIRCVLLVKAAELEGYYLPPSSAED